MFGGYRKITTPELFKFVPRETVLGNDIFDELMNVNHMLLWDANRAGVVNLGNVKVKKPDFQKWCACTFQTCVWLGTSIPSKSSQLRSVGLAGKGKGKSKGKHS